MLAPGQIIGSYELLRQLGAGAFGEVWLVRHLDLGVQRAMKIPTDPDYVRQLRKEGQIQFNLHHPNIVATVDLDLRGSPPYMVMEYIEGQNLRQVLGARGNLPVNEALGVLCQILEALQAAHAVGVLHRDIKPENVLLTPDGTVKVTDFGLGRVQDEVTRSLFLSGSMLSSEGKSLSGTLEYMSPEQAAGKGADPRDDIYAIGIIGYELLLGTRPALSGVSKGLQRAGVVDDVVEVIEKACEELEYRYSSAGEILGDLRALRSGWPTSLDGAQRRAAEARGKRDERLRADEHLRKQALDGGGRTESSRKADGEGKAQKSEEENLRLLARSGLLESFVSEHRGSWNHADWLAFLRQLEQGGFWPINVDAVGQALGKRRAGWQRTTGVGAGGTSPRKLDAAKVESMRQLHLKVGRIRVLGGRTSRTVLAVWFFLALTGSFVLCSHKRFPAFIIAGLIGTAMFMAPAAVVLGLVALDCKRRRDELVTLEFRVQIAGWLREGYTLQSIEEYLPRMQLVA